MPTKQKDGRYRTHAVVGHTADGKAIIVYASGRTKKELAEDLERKKRAKMGPAPTSREDVTLREFAEPWYKAFKEPNLRASTKEMYRNALDKHIYPALGAEQLRALTSFKVQTYINTLKGRSASLIRIVMLTMNQIFERAVVDRVIERILWWGWLRLQAPRESVVT